MLAIVGEERLLERSPVAAPLDRDPQPLRRPDERDPGRAAAPLPRRRRGGAAAARPLDRRDRGGAAQHRLSGDRRARGRGLAAAARRRPQECADGRSCDRQAERAEAPAVERAPRRRRGARSGLRGELLGRLARCSARETRRTCWRSTATRGSSTRSATRCAGDRLALLDAFEADLARIFDGRQPAHPVLARLAPTVAALRLPREPFQRLIEANRRDQEQVAYATYDELLGYCDLSANPVGELVLHVFGAATPDGSRSPTASAPRSSSPSTGRTSPRTTGRPGLPPRRGSRAVRGRPRASSAARAARRRFARCSPSRSRAPARSSTRARRSSAACGAARGSRSPATSAAAGPRSTRSSAAGYDVLAGRRGRRAARRARADAHDATCGGAERSAEIERAYEHCRRSPASRGSSFYAGMRLLPPERRAALFAVYALARRIDDIADGELAPAEKLAALARLAARARPAEPQPTRSCSRSQTPPRRFPIPLAAFDELIDGAEKDVARRALRDLRRARALLPPRRRHDRPALTRRLRLLRPRSPATLLADDLGVALQIGNILRDVGEDAAAGRVYLPAEDLDRFGCEPARAASSGPIELVDRLRGRAWPRLAPARARARAAARPPQRLLRARDGREVPAPARADRREPTLVLRERLSLRPWEKGLVLARSLAGAGA